MFRKVFPLAALLGILLVNAAAADDIRVFLGTYTGGESEGIYVATLDRTSGTLSKPQLAGEADNPAFVALHPSQPVLYSVSEVREPEGSVTAFAIDPKSAKLTPINKQSTQGGGPCHLSVSPSGRAVVAANYGGGSVCSFPLADDGSLEEAASFIQHEGASVNRQRQEGPHAHSANFDPSGEHVVVCDLGLDKVFVYDMDPQTAQLTLHDPPSTSVPAGGGPRHFAFHPGGQFAYANLEMASAVQAFLYHPEEAVLYGMQTISSLPDDSNADNTTAEIQVHPAGKFVYVSNRGDNSIAIFRVDATTGELTAAGHASTHGQTPRNFGIDPSGRYLLAANQQTDNVVAFRIDPKTGALSETGASIQVPSPVCVRFWK